MSNWLRANKVRFWDLAMVVVRDDGGGSPHSQSESTAPIALKKPIYRFRSGPRLQRREPGRQEEGPCST